MVKRGFAIHFGMLFSIIMIAIIVVVAFYAISKFLSLNTCAQVGEFKENFEDRVDKAYFGSITRDSFSGNLPRGVEYVCFGNLSNGLHINTVEQERIRDYMVQESLAPRGVNMFIYPEDESCGADLAYYKMPKITTPGDKFVCIPADGGKIDIKIQKGNRDSLVTVSN
jgi:hypothetical protein